MEDTPIYNPPATASLTRYITHKVVHAVRIQFIMDCPGDSADLLLVGGDKITVPRDWVQQRGALPGGYYIVYADGYTSWSPAEAFEASATVSELWGMQRAQEPKYCVNLQGRIANRHSGQAIPDSEPVFILRAQDLHALPALVYYRDLVPVDRRAALDERVLAFSFFKEAFPERMKLADSKPPTPPVPSSIGGGRGE